MNRGFLSLKIIFLVVVIGGLFIPLPYYNTGYCDIPCPSPDQCSLCPKKGWYLGDSLWKKNISALQHANRKEETTVKITPQSQQPNKSEETTNWKTYTNTSYRYSINYPNSWEVKNLGSIDPKTLELVAFNPGQVENEFSAVSIIVSGRTYEQELELLGPNAQPAKINYQNASRVIHGSPDGKEYIIVLFNLNSGQNALRIEAKSEHQNIFEKILSTFKFQ